MRYLHSELRTVQQLARDEQLHQDNLKTSPQPASIQADNILNFPPISAVASSVSNNSPAKHDLQAANKDQHLNQPAAPSAPAVEPLAILATAAVTSNFKIASQPTVSDQPPSPMVLPVPPPSTGIPPNIRLGLIPGLPDETKNQKKKRLRRERKAKEKEDKTDEANPDDELSNGEKDNANDSKTTEEITTAEKQMDDLYNSLVREMDNEKIDSPNLNQN